MPVTTRIAVCTRRLSLLCRWLSLSQEYSRAVIATKNSKPEAGNRAFLLGIIADVKSQMDAAREEFELHRMTHGC
jgi:hypothetical protein